MGARFRKPEEVRIDLEGGDWLLVKKHLTAGEARHAQAKIIKGETFHPGDRPELNLENLEVAQAVEYLLDWNLTDAFDRPIVIRDKGFDMVAAALKAMSSESLREILNAIQAHDAAMEAERAHEKKAATGSPSPDQTSTFVA